MLDSRERSEQGALPRSKQLPLCVCVCVCVCVNQAEIKFQTQMLTPKDIPEEYWNNDYTLVPCPPEDRLDQLNWIIQDIQLVDITPKLSVFSGLEPQTLIRERNGYYSGDQAYELYDFQLTGTKAYNPHYWDYITLNCNKTYNKGHIVNQEQYNEDIDESTKLYK